MKRPPEPEQTFEEVYPKHRFSELVRLSVSLAKMLARLRRRQSGKRPHTLPSDRAAAPRKWRPRALVEQQVRDQADREDGFAGALNFGISPGLAGAAGIEPANAGTKNRCLTTWLRPIRVRGWRKIAPLTGRCNGSGS